MASSFGFRWGLVYRGLVFFVHFVACSITFWPLTPSKSIGHSLTMEILHPFHAWLSVSHCAKLSSPSVCAILYLSIDTPGAILSSSTETPVCRLSLTGSSAVPNKQVVNIRVHLCRWHFSTLVWFVSGCLHARVTRGLGWIQLSDLTFGHAPFKNRGLGSSYISHLAFGHAPSKRSPTRNFKEHVCCRLGSSMYMYRPCVESSSS